MPVTIAMIEKWVGKVHAGRTKWGTNCPSRASGVYVIALPACGSWSLHLDTAAIKYWVLNTSPKTFRDRARLDESELANELRSFWHDNETIVYVGRATHLRNRLYQFYGTPLGHRGPHAGGYWINTLRNLRDLEVYWFEDRDPKRLERTILEHFDQTGKHASDLYLPYANLEMDSRRRKNRRIRRPSIR